MPTQSNTIELAKQLIACQSVTPEDAGCQSIMLDRLSAMGFDIVSLPFGEVENFWAVHGQSGPIVCFAGHTDVVPSGPESSWQTPPFKPTIIDGQLHGRGAADMKGSLAAMVVAVEQFIQQHPDHSGRIAFLITSDEEGIAVNGTVKVVDWLSDQQIIPDYCLVGEPSSSDQCGDVIKNGRRGSLGCKITFLGKQGHVAYPHLATNPIHCSLSALAALTSEVWDNGNEFFPATSFQVSNINAGTGVTNVIPGELEVIANFRYSTEVTEQQLRQRTEAILDDHGVAYKIDWTLNGLPFLTAEGDLVEACVSSIKEVTGLDTQLSTAGGTSDGRFIAQLGGQVIELGPVNATIHQVDENTNIDDLEKLTLIYKAVLTRLLG
jgi:succinyl-diaminopimelate desuccinylase